MITLVLTAVPVGLRGYLTRWLLEIAAGVYTGHVSAKVREAIWDRTVELSKSGRAIMVYPAANEQRFEVRVHRHDWEPVDFDGLTLMRRPEGDGPVSNPNRPGWSKASRYRRAGY